MSDEINYSTGFSWRDIVSWGSSGVIYLDNRSQTVVKSPHGEENKDAIAIEKSIYERFTQCGGHERFLDYLGPYESGIRLEYACNGNLRTFLKERAKDIDIEQRLRWANQVADALRVVHSTKVVHGDVTCGNILLDDQLNTKLSDTKLSDFGGSLLDGSSLLVAGISQTNNCNSV